MDKATHVKARSIVSNLEILKKEEELKNDAEYRLLRAERAFYKACYKGKPQAEIDKLATSVDELKAKSEINNRAFKTSSQLIIKKCAHVFFQQMSFSYDRTKAPVSAALDIIEHFEHALETDEGNLGSKGEDASANSQLQQENSGKNGSDGECSVTFSHFSGQNYYSTPETSYENENANPKSACARCINGITSSSDSISSSDSSSASVPGSVSVSGSLYLNHWLTEVSRGRGSRSGNICQINQSPFACIEEEQENDNNNGAIQRVGFTRGVQENDDYF